MAIHSQAEVDAAISEIKNKARLEVYLTATESFTGAQNTWYSPSANVALTGDLQDGFEYVGGSIKYTGTDPVKVILKSTVTLQVATVGVTLEFALGKNGTPDVKSIQSTESFQATTPRELTCIKTFELITNDELDFFTRQSSSVADQQIDILRGVWVVNKA